MIKQPPKKILFSQVKVLMKGNNNSKTLAFAKIQLLFTRKSIILCVFLVATVLVGCSSARSRGRHGESFNLSKECYHRYSNKDHHQTFSDWLYHKNSSHYSPISPTYHQALIKIQAENLAHGLQVTSGVSSCNSRKMRVISASTPLRERALCQFEYVLNYKPNRIPSTLTEVRCSCQRPSHQLIGKRMFECEPLRYQVRVLLFDEQCSTYVEETETISLACIPVQQANTNANSQSELSNLLIPIPAEAPYQNL